MLLTLPPVHPAIWRGPIERHVWHVCCSCGFAKFVQSYNGRRTLSRVRKLNVGLRRGVPTAVIAIVAGGVVAAGNRSVT
jgi:hypothetical protein